MKALFRTAAAFMLAALAACATGMKPPSSDRAATVTYVMNAVQSVHAAAGQGDHSKTAQLAQLLPTVKAVIAANPDDIISLAASDYQGEIAVALNGERTRQGLPLDPQLTADAMAGFGKVVGAKQDAPQWQVTYGNAAYRMGSAAYLAGDYDTARRTFQTCATELRHPGCVNSLADILLKGSPPSGEDLATALRLFKDTATTGINGTCAGSFSAGTVAAFIHFKVTPTATGNALGWLAAARALAQQAKAMTGGNTDCHAPIVDVDEYLMRADDGDLRPALLEGVARDAKRSSDRALAEYLIGRIDETELARRLEEPRLLPYERCDIEFSLLWNANRVGDQGTARRHFAALQALPPLTCLQERVFSRTMGYLP